MAHTRQSMPDFGLGFQVKVLKIVSGVSSSLGSGMAAVPVLIEVSPPFGSLDNFVWEGYVSYSSYFEAETENSRFKIAQNGRFDKSQTLTQV